MKTYKVVKSVDIFEKGDMFTKNEDGTYTCKLTEEYNNRKCTTAITISSGYMAEAILQGIVIVMNTEDEKLNNTEIALSKLNKLAKTYQEDINDTQDKYKSGDLSEMQKAESVTVLSNLLKLTNHIKSILNGSN